MSRAEARVHLHVVDTLTPAIRRTVKRLRISRNYTPGLLIRTPAHYSETLPEQDDDAAWLQNLLLDNRPELADRVASLKRRWTT